MRRDKWEQALENLINRLGPTKGMQRFRELWRDAGEKLIKDYEKESAFM